MARIRTIKPEFWTSEQVVECSVMARLLFIGIWNFADDAGIHTASAKKLKGQIFPHDDVDAASVRRMIDELASNRLIRLYEVEGVEYLIVTGWAKHQKVDRPSYRHPKPPETPPAGVEDQHVTRRMLVDPHPPEGNGREGNGREGIESSQPSSSQSAPARAPDRDPVADLIAAFDAARRAAWPGCAARNEAHSDRRVAAALLAQGWTVAEFGPWVQSTLADVAKRSPQVAQAMAFIENDAAAYRARRGKRLGAGANGPRPYGDWHDLAAEGWDPFVAKHRVARDKGATAWTRSDMGPAPGEPGCLVPATVQQRHGFVPAPCET